MEPSTLSTILGKAMQVGPAAVAAAALLAPPPPTPLHRSPAAQLTRTQRPTPPARPPARLPARPAGLPRSRGGQEGAGAGAPQVCAHKVHSAGQAGRLHLKRQGGERDFLGGGRLSGCALHAGCLWLRATLFG